MMQAQRAARAGVGTTIPRRGGRRRRRRRLEALLTVAAILVIVAVMALMTRGVVAPATGGARDANLKAGVSSAIVHDDAGNMPATDVSTAIVHDDAGNVR